MNLYHIAGTCKENGHTVPFSEFVVAVAIEEAMAMSKKTHNDVKIESAELDRRDVKVMK